MKTILITGGSGMIGRALTDFFKHKGYNIIWLSRERYIKGKTPRYRWDYQKGEIDEEAVKKADIIIHLAGKNVADEAWTRAEKQRIVESRVKTAQLLFKTVKKLNKKLDVFISASAIGYYGQSISEKIFTEKDSYQHRSFMGRTCRKWEHEASQFSEQLNIRSVMLRTGVVFSKNSEALKKMAAPARYGLAAPIASGKQYVNWIHIDDLCGIYQKAIEDPKMQGPYNAVSPHFVTNKEVMHTIAKVYRRPFFMPPLPAFFLRLRYGQAAELFIKGSRISSEKIRDAGYQFKYPELKAALKACLKE